MIGSQSENEGLANADGLRFLLEVGKFESVAMEYVFVDNGRSFLPTR